VSSGKSNRPIRVLVADDSALARELICAILNSEPGMNVVGEAADGLEAVSKVLALKPDLVTMDIEMPVLGGHEAIERIMAQFPLPILVITAQSGVRAAFTAVSKGAMAVVEKPDISMESAQNLVNKVRMLSNLDIHAYMAAKSRKGEKPQGPPPVPKTTRENVNIIAIAASIGGPQAIYAILSRLPANFPTPILIAQHIADGFTPGMVEWLKSATPLRVCEMRHGDRLSPGTVHINPAEFSVTAIRQETLILKGRDGKEPYHPSCDALLRSVAQAYRERSAGLILSGMGRDGVEGMRAIKSTGGVTIAQDAKSSVVYGMNRLAVEGGYVGKVIPLNQIPAELVRLAGAKEEYA